MLSRALLIELLPHVDGCVADTVGREREGDSKLLVPGDVALGVCLYERLGVQCSMSQEASKNIYDCFTVIRNYVIGGGGGGGG